MRSQEVAFDEAHSSLRRLGVPVVLPALHAVGLGISRTVLGGSHSVAVYPPLDALTHVEPLALVDAVDWGTDTSLYVHIAFCETRCTFCHYAVDHYPARQRGSDAGDGRVVRYLAALKREMASWGARLARSGTAVSSVYIGGGTPLVLDGAALTDLLRTVRHEFEVLPGAEVCVEGSPLTITAPDGEDKLRLLAAQGVTRLSFGVQSFDDTVLKYAARGYRRDLAIGACTIADRVFDNWNVDLIQGLYQGSPSETWHNLSAIAEVCPPHVTWYHGRFADRPQGRWLLSQPRQANFEDEVATLLGRVLIWQEMALLGYHRTDGNRFVRARRFTDPFKQIRTSASSDILGVGAASYSHVGDKSSTRHGRGYTFRNEPGIRAYTDVTLAGGVPVTTGRVIDGAELLASSYATGLRCGRVENAHLRAARIASPELSGHYDSLVTTLSDAGVLEAYRDDDGRAGLRLSELGRLFEDETLALFFSPAVKSALAEKAAAGRQPHHAETGTGG